MAWIESHQELARHPKTKKLARTLGISLPSAVGHLHFFWWWAMDYAQDGDISKFDEMDIADACSWDGESSDLYSALINTGFVDRTNDGVCIHDWEDYAGRLIEKRRANTERKRKSRSSHAAVTQDKQGSHGATVPNLTVPNHIDHDDNNNAPAREENSHNIARTFEQEFGRPIGATEHEKLKGYVDSGMDADVVCEAIKRTRLQGKTNTAYALSILQGWLAEQVTNMAGVARVDLEFEARKKEKPGKARSPDGKPRRQPDSKKREAIKSLYMS